jgi:hypothetical protein
MIPLRVISPQRRLIMMMRRANALAAELPDNPDDIDVDNPAVMAKIRMLLAEHSKVVCEINKILGLDDDPQPQQAEADED